MSKYIDADKLNLYDELFMKGVNNSGVWVRYRDVENLIKNAPTADVREVKRGKWNLQEENTDANGNNLYTCTMCGAGDIHASFVNVPFCWKCGAEMGGKENKDE